MYNRFIAAAAFAVAAANAQSSEDMMQYARWNAAMDRVGFTWEPYEVETKDGWHLTLFRITGRRDGNVMHSDEHHAPVLITHGLTMDAVSWAEVAGPNGEASWPLQLVDRGYDVWMASNRGTEPYSGHHRDEDRMTKEEKWDFSFAEMGKYDQPAFFDKVLEVTGEKRLTYMGYSQGTAQMFYALASDDYLNDKLESVVMVGPCLYGNFNSSYEELVDQFQGFKKIGVYSLGGDTWQEDVQKMCDNMSEEVCNSYKYLPDTISPGPIGTLQHLYQNGVEDRFMERIPIEEYAAGRRSAPELEYKGLDDSFLINFVVGERDDGCNMDQVKRIARDMDDAAYVFHTEYDYDHYSIAVSTDPMYIERIVGYIEEGAEYRRSRDDEDGMSTAILDWIFGMDGASALVTSSALALSALALASF